ncbi:Xylose isomerase-like TIM barrel domain-containing protein OS=Streptomyces fumanus OX=67302 GN=GCM10018772_58540 PE=4 SV=1 [Streptomyces fumanus]
MTLFPRTTGTDAPTADGPDEALRRSLGVGRRRFLTTCTAVAGAAVAAPVFGASPALAHDQDRGRGHGHGHGHGHGGDVLVPADKRGIILYTVRDATARDPLASDLPSGFREVFKQLARHGYRQVEFAGYNQHANAPGGASLESVAGAKLLRSWLDEYGLRAQGNHGFIPSSWPLTSADLDTFKKHLEIANILGMAHMGTGGDPTGSSYRADWDVAADKWNALGEIARREGIKLYTHNHDAAYGFLLDGGPLDAQGRPTRSSGIRKLEYFLKVTDPRLVWLEMDIFWAHVAQYSSTPTRLTTAPPAGTSSTRPAWWPGTTSATRCSTPRTASSAPPDGMGYDDGSRSGPASSTTRRSSPGSGTAELPQPDDRGRQLPERHRPRGEFG